MPEDEIHIEVRGRSSTYHNYLESILEFLFLGLLFSIVESQKHGVLNTTTDSRSIVRCSPKLITHRAHLERVKVKYEAKAFSNGVPCLPGRYHELLERVPSDNLSAPTSHLEI
jgi:hypothetical protein